MKVRSVVLPGARRRFLFPWSSKDSGGAAAPRVARVEPGPITPILGGDASELLAAVTARLHERGERLTVQRKAVLLALLAHGGHPTADDLIASVERSATSAHRASVYRALEALCALGVVQHVHLGHGAATYHLAEAAGGHAHAQCSHCGGVIDVPLMVMDDLAMRLERSCGFRLDRSHVALSGLCEECAASAD